MAHAPSTRHAFTLEVELAPPIDVGETPHGRRRVIPITGGTFSGPDARGQVLPGGADWNLVRPDGVTHLWARYTLRTDDGHHLMVTNEGWGTRDEASVRRISAGGGGEPDGWYCRTNPRFEVGEGPYAWMNHTLFIGDLRPPVGLDRVTIVVHRVT
ncbi:DUF3237 domain-containing protein [Streptomyces sp. NPDC003247]|uniref:DUF3237 domain-containing protein n=1 Tax=Streptomyces sp. NPDC003247 TaxID=3364677 RepID=UPI00369206F6